jgi:hypothetical protein
MAGTSAADDDGGAALHGGMDPLQPPSPTALSPSPPLPRRRLAAFEALSEGAALQVMPAARVWQA